MTTAPQHQENIVIAVLGPGQRLRVGEPFTASSADGIQFCGAEGLVHSINSKPSVMTLQFTS